jgi:hypothetical protein
LNNMATGTPRTPRRKISEIDFAAGEAFLETASLLIVPDGQSQRQAFERFMPQIYCMRNKGCSYPQIAHTLTKVGFNLQPSAVRNYYNEFLATRMEMCQARMNEQILLLAEVRKQTKGLDVGSIAARVEAIMSKQRAEVDGKLDSVFGAVAATPPQNGKKAGRSPALTPAPTPAADVESGGEFGLLSSAGDVVQQASVVPAFFGDSEEGGAVAVPGDFPQAASPPKVKVQADNLRCQPLVAGVPALDRRDNVPDHVYLEGDLEHPAVPGLLLSLDQRLSSVALEFVNLDSGEIRLETPFEKRFRVMWKKPIPMTETSTSGDFTRMDPSLMK